MASVESWGGGDERTTGSRFAAGYGTRELNDEEMVAALNLTGHRVWTLRDLQDARAQADASAATHRVVAGQSLVDWVESGNSSAQWVYIFLSEPLKASLRPEDRLARISEVDALVDAFVAGHGDALDGAAWHRLGSTAGLRARLRPERVVHLLSDPDVRKIALAAAPPTPLLPPLTLRDVRETIQATEFWAWGHSATGDNKTRSQAGSPPGGATWEVRLYGAVVPKSKHPTHLHNEKKREVYVYVLWEDGDRDDADGLPPSWVY